MGTPTTLTGLLAATAAAHADRPAVTDATGTLSWRALAARAEGLAACLAGAGVGPGERVALWLPNSAEYLALCFAVGRLGAVAVHVNTRFRATEVAGLLARARPGVLVTDAGFAPVDFLAVLDEVPAEARAGLREVLARHAGGTAARALEPGGSTPDLAGADVPCLTWTTSGTTSGPKLVLHGHRAVARHAGEAMRAIGLDATGAVLLAALPLCGTFGNAAAMAAVAGGAHVVCMDRFDPDQADELIRRHRVTHMVGGSDMLERLAVAAGGRRHDSLRFFGYAAFHPNAPAAVAAADALGFAPRGLYGSSELQALFACAPAAWRLEPGGEPVSPDAEFAVRDPFSGADLPDGAAGELCVRAPSLFLGYFDDPAATARAMTADGLFRTGDLVVRRGRGFVFQTRMGDSLRLGGYLVSPEEIEAFLCARDGIRAAQVVAAAHAGETKAVAFVIAAGDAEPDEAALLACCRAKLARFKVPARIVVLEEFPVTQSPNGTKIQRVKLREMAAALLAGG